MSNKNPRKKKIPWSQKKRQWGRQKRREEMKKLTPEELRRYHEAKDRERNDRKGHYISAARAFRRVDNKLERTVRSSDNATDVLILNLINPGA